MGAFVALVVGYMLGAKTGAKELDRLRRSLKALYGTEEFADVLSAARAQVGAGLRELASVIDGERMVPDTGRRPRRASQEPCRAGVTRGPDALRHVLTYSPQADRSAGRADRRLGSHLQASRLAARPNDPVLGLKGPPRCDGPLHRASEAFPVVVVDHPRDGSRTCRRTRSG